MRLRRFTLAVMPLALRACRRGLALVAAAILVTGVVAAEPSPLRVGEWDLEQRAVFAVAAAQLSADVHFVYMAGSRLLHARSSDGGSTWSIPQIVAAGSTPELAVDRQGMAHLVYEVAGTSRIEYRSFDRGAWSPAIDLSASVPGKPAQMLVPRIAVDGADHVHVVYWTLWKDQEWKPGSRTAYWRKPAGAARFEPPILWSHSRQGGNARYATPVVDPSGNLHVFYATNHHNSHAVERRVRRRDGGWGVHDLWSGHLLTDWCIGAAVTTGGVVHLTVQSKLNDGLHVFHASTRADPATRTLEHDFGPENYETFTQLLGDPSGDLWLATGHLEDPDEAARSRAPVRPNIGMWARYSSATGIWSERAPVSPPGAINLDARRGNHPRLVLVNGKVHIFYAEKQPGEKWRHWQRRLGP